MLGLRSLVIIVIATMASPSASDEIQILSPYTRAVGEAAKASGDAEVQQANIVGDEDGRCRMSRAALGACSAYRRGLRERNVYVYCPWHTPAHGTGVMINAEIVCTAAHIFLKDGNPKGPLSSCLVRTQGSIAQTSSLRWQQNHEFPTRRPELKSEQALDPFCAKLATPFSNVKPISIDFSGELLENAEEIVAVAAFQVRMQTSGECKAHGASEPIAQVCNKKELRSGYGGRGKLIFTDCDLGKGGSGGPLYVCNDQEPILVGISTDAGLGAADGKPYDAGEGLRDEDRSFSGGVAFDERLLKDIAALTGTPNSRAEPRVARSPASSSE